MKSIDAEILEVEQRLHEREAAIKREARELRSRGTRALISPLTIGAALVLGFVAAGSAARRKATAPMRYRDRRKQTKEQSKGFAVGGLLMTAATWLVKNQFGGPAGLARFVISKVRKNERHARPPGLRTGV
jgi:hypothetical protein